MADFRKVALVTGAASGIGRATADLFLQRGYDVALLDRDEALGQQTERELQSTGDCRFIPCDVTDESSVQSAVSRTIEIFGRIDAAFNSAGVDGKPSLCTEGTLDNWDRVMNVNLRGVWLCLKHIIPYMQKQGSGAIVNCSSGAGLMGVAGLSAYVASKHGVIGLTKSAALEFARQNIRINAVCPGMVDTPMWQNSITPALQQQLLANDPFGRMGQPIEIAEAVVWLCSSSASFVNGHAMVVDGGMTID